MSKEYVDWEGNTIRNADLGNGKIQAIATGYQYDKKGSVIKETYTNGDYKAYEYDGRNRLVQVTWYKADGTGTLQTKYTYSTSDQVLIMEDFRVEGGTKNRHRYTAYEYDDMNQLTAQAEYDGSEIPTKDQIRERQTRYAYDKDGKLLEVTYSKTENGVVSLQYQYNEYGWLSKVKAKLENGDSSTLRDYLYNSDGKICEIRDYPEFAVNPSGHYVSKRYEFDDLMRITHMEYRSSLQPDRIRESYDYAYDKNSNIISESIKNDWSTRAEGRANEVRTHTYDVENRLDQVTVKSNGSTALDQKNVYNGEGQRVQKTENGSVTKYYYQDGAVQHTTDGEGNKTSFHLLGLENQVIMSGRYDSAYAGKYYQYNRDIRGSITDILDQEDNCQVSYKYSDFGETQRYGVQDFYNEICYSGGIYDESTELYYLNARYYDPESGRFLSQDTYRGETDEEETWNLYVYCANNPVKYVDPSGHSVVAGYIFYEVLTIVLSIGVTYEFSKGFARVLSRKTLPRDFGGIARYGYDAQRVAPVISPPKTSKPNPKTSTPPRSAAAGSGNKATTSSSCVPYAAAGVQSKQSSKKKDEKKKKTTQNSNKAGQKKQGRELRNKGRKKEGFVKRNDTRHERKERKHTPSRKGHDRVRQNQKKEEYYSKNKKNRGLKH